MQGVIDGGDGQDTLVLNFDNPWWTHAWGGDALYYSGVTTPIWNIDLRNWSWSQLERLEVTGFNATMPWTYPDEIILSAEQLESLQSATGLRKVAIVGGGSIDLTHLSTLGLRIDGHS
jgi:hypothetical protein